MCDAKEGDLSCGKCLTRATRNVEQLCRQCQVTTLQTNAHLANFWAKTQKKIQKLVERGKEEEELCLPLGILWYVEEEDSP